MKEINIREHLALYGIRPVLCRNSWEWLEKELGRKDALKTARLTRPFFRGKKPSKKEILAYFGHKANPRIGAALHSLQCGGIEATANAVQPFLSGVRNILDLGCGSGFLTAWIARQNPEAKITAVDFSGPALAEAKRASARLGIKNISFQELDFTRQWPAGKYDLILDVQAVYRSAKRAEVFRKVFHSLNTRGCLLSVAALPNARAAGIHCRAMRQAGLKIKKFTLAFYQDAEENGAYSVISAGKNGAEQALELKAAFQRALCKITAAETVPEKAQV